MKNIPKILLITTAVIYSAVFYAFPILSAKNQMQNIFQDTSLVSEHNVGIVFGAGIKPDNTPTDMLNDRLKVAADLYHKGKIKSILVSGDNTTKTYSEPDVMQETLVETYNIPESVIYKDYAGRRTYDTCIRANKLWGIEHAILITQGYHLPRALITCNNLKIEAKGVSATLQPYVFSTKYKIREILAIYKAYIDIYILKPSYIGGEFQIDLDN